MQNQNQIFSTKFVDLPFDSRDRVRQHLMDKIDEDWVKISALFSELKKVDYLLKVLKQERDDFFSAGVTFQVLTKTRQELYEEYDMLLTQSERTISNQQEINNLFTPVPTLY